MKNQLTIAPLCALLALVASPGLSAAERAASFPVTEQQMKALDIRTDVLRPGAEPVVLNLPARAAVSPERERIVSAPLAGLVLELLVQPNQPVKPGTPLLRLASPELGTLQLQLMQAASRAALARQAAQRERALFDEGIIAERRVQESQAALADSEAALRHARAALRLAGMPAATIDRVAANGKPEDGLTITAARAGIVTAIEVKPGQRVDPAAALLQLAQTDRMALEIQAPAADAAAWRVGGKLLLQGRAGQASITSISPVVAAGSQTVAIRATLDAAAQVRPGELVTVQLALAAAAGSWDAPLAALMHQGSQAYVFVRQRDGFEARPVTLLASAGQRVRIQGPLKAGERIAVSGVVALKGSWLGEKGGE
jgi:cobalt-zinc-cadmium efflux system membrane fusion protein